MALSISEIERAGAGGNRTDEPLPQAQLRQVNGLRVQAFCSIKFENAVSAENIEGANFRDHVLGDFADDPVKTCLRFQRFRH